jgi:predicted site-specific integrase-resolvase
MESEILLLTSDDVAKILRISKRTLQNYRTEGKLVYYKCSRKNIIYRAEDVIAFLKQSNCCSYQKDTYQKLIEKYRVHL